MKRQAERRGEDVFNFSKAAAEEDEDVVPGPEGEEPLEVEPDIAFWDMKDEDYLILILTRTNAIMHRVPVLRRSLNPLESTTSRVSTNQSRSRNGRWVFSCGCLPT